MIWLLPFVVIPQGSAVVLAVACSRSSTLELTSPHPYTPTPHHEIVILSEETRGFIVRFAVEGPAFRW